MTKVYLPTAGKGTRMGGCAKYANKAILPVNFKALFTHIIEKFPFLINVLKSTSTMDIKGTKSNTKST